MKRYKNKEIVKMLIADGWYELPRTASGHRQFKHSVKNGRVTLHGKDSDTVDQFLLNSIFKQAGWR